MPFLKQGGGFLPKAPNQNRKNLLTTPTELLCGIFNLPNTTPNHPKTTPHLLINQPHQTTPPQFPPKPTFLSPLKLHFQNFLNSYFLTLELFFPISLFLAIISFKTISFLSTNYLSKITVKIPRQHCFKSTLFILSINEIIDLPKPNYPHPKIPQQSPKNHDHDFQNYPSLSYLKVIHRYFKLSTELSTALMRLSTQ